MVKKKPANTKQIVNRKAKFEYQLLDSFEAGLVLKGTEVKSIKEGNANLADAYCLFENGNLTLKSMFVAEYKFGTIHNHEPKEDRRLLLRKTELKKLQRRVTEKGMTIVPYKLYFSERGFIKIELFLAVGKKSYDKRESIKERQNKRDLDRVKKEYK